MTLQDWVNQSPNATSNNTLIQTVGLKAGKPVYYSYHWNLRPLDPEEKAVYTTPAGVVITREEAFDLL